MPAELTIIVYRRPKGDEPLTKWLEKLGDIEARNRIMRRINRLRSGLFGDVRRLAAGEGISELRFDFGPGYRVYFAEMGPEAIVLLCAGTKKTQENDIEKALSYWRDYQTRKQI